MLSSLPILLLTLSAVEAGQPIAPSAPWAIAPEGPRTQLEALTGERIDPRTFPVIRSGTLVFDGESMSADMLKALDLPPSTALDRDPTPGILYLAMDGVTLKPTCGGPQIANAALNCSPLVKKETVFPAAGSAQTKSAIQQKLTQYYSAFNILIAAQRPPDWLPYTMAVIGGTSGNAGQPNGVCGIANVACDGAKRNHVSLSFPGSCGAAAETAAQESAHNWGLEHTDVKSDLMYPYLEGAGQFRNECMNISHATGSGKTQCGYVHKLYCPAGGGEQQNSFDELLGVFGPRVADTTKPTIVAMTPEDGAVFTSADTFKVSATLADDSNYLGVKWTWLEGLPEELQEKGYTRCTNDVCSDSFFIWSKVEQAWDFVNFIKPPAGNYKFKLETMDMAGNYATRTLSVTVMAAGPDDDPTTGGATGATSEGGEGTGGEPDPTEGEGSEAGDSAPTEGGGETGALSGGGGASDGDPGSASGQDNSASGSAGGGGDDGGCRVAGAPGPASLLLLLALGARRRRRA